MDNITAIVVTLNEEENLKDCLSSLGFAGEIIVVDSNSTDSTASIARDFNHRLINTDILYPEELTTIEIFGCKELISLMIFDILF